LTYRIYFHKRDGNDPVVWAFDEGDQSIEIHVQWISIVNVAATTRVDLQAKDGSPCAWIEVNECVAKLQHGGVTFERETTNAYCLSGRVL